MLRRPGPRFVLWVVLLVGVATAAGLAHFGWWLIALLEFAAWVVVAVVERSLSHPKPVGFVAPVAPVLDTAETLSYVRVLPPSPERIVVEPEPAPAAVFEELPVAVPEPVAPPAVVRLEPVPRPPAIEERQERKSGLISRQFRGAPARPEQSATRSGRTFGSAPMQWNVWSLERVAREQAADNEELSFLVIHLRDYASPEGLLPIELDGLVRQSFGSLLESTAV